MTPEQAAAYVMAQAACAMAEIVGMLVDNQIAERDNRYPRYGKRDFEKVIETNVIGHNAVLSLYQDINRGST